ncbi:MAG TPA: hypothetical protein VFZ78_06245 [Flavisolibacter sp.]
MKRSQFFILIGLLAFGCMADADEPVVDHHKDLGQNMMDLRIYQENLGDQVKSKKLEDASWLLEGMDSILLILNRKFDEHRKLNAPFSYYYKKELKDPIHGIRKAIRKNDTAKALQHYRILIDNCNDCHIDHEIDKEVKF